MKRAITFGAVVAFLALTWLIYSKVVEMRRDNGYRAALTRFQRTLPVGMSKTDAKKYLDAQKINYNSVGFGGGRGDTYEIKIGEEPGDALVCKSWSVYVALEFGPQNTLDEAHIRKEGICL